MKKIQRLSWFIVFLLATSTISAQNRTIDSLKSVLALSGKPDDFKVLWELAYELFDVDNVQALQYASHAHQVALKIGDSLEIVKSGRLKGQLLRRFDRLDESLRVLKYILPIATRHQFSSELEYIFNALAIVHTGKLEFDKALEWHFRSLVVREKQGDGKKISVTLLNIGYVYFKIGSYNEAKYYYLKCLETKRGLNDLYDLDRLYINIGLCHNLIGEFEEAKTYYSKALEICKPNCGNQIILESEMGFANSFFIEKDYEQAKIHFLQALNLSKKDNSRRFQIESLKDLASISLLKNELNQVQDYLSELESLVELKEYPEYMLDFYRLNAEYYLHTRNFRLASSFQKKHAELREKTFGQELNMNLARVQTKFAERENLSKINEQKEKLAFQQQAIRQQTLLNLSIIIVVVLTIAIILVLIKVNRQKQMVNEILNLRVKERTKELEKNRDQLQHAHDEQSIILSRVSRDLNASLATFKGLSKVATIELPASKAIFFKEAENMAEKMVSYVNKNSIPE